MEKKFGYGIDRAKKVADCRHIDYKYWQMLVLARSFLIIIN